MNWLIKFFRNLFQFSRKKTPKSKYYSVKRTELSINSDFFDAPFRVDVYLPYRHQSSAISPKLPLLLFNDGQDMAAVQLEETMQSLINAARTPPFAVAAVYPQNRLQEYGTRYQPDYQQRGSASTRYQDFLVNELLPKLREKYQFSAARKDSFIAGFSLGGLSAFDTAWHFPRFFGRVGVFSGSFWWRSRPFVPTAPDDDLIVSSRIQQEGVGKPLKYWLQTGTLDETNDRNNNGVIDSIDDTLMVIRDLERVGTPAKDITYVEILDGKHDTETWAKVLPEFLIWLFR